MIGRRKKYPSLDDYDNHVNGSEYNYCGEYDADIFSFDDEMYLLDEEGYYLIKLKAGEDDE